MRASLLHVVVSGVVDRPTVRLAVHPSTELVGWMPLRVMCTRHGIYAGCSTGAMQARCQNAGRMGLLWYGVSTQVRSPSVSFRRQPHILTDDNGAVRALTQHFRLVVIVGSLPEEMEPALFPECQKLDVKETAVLEPSRLRRHNSANKATGCSALGRRPFARPPGSGRAVVFFCHVLDGNCRDDDRRSGQSEAVVELSRPSL